MGVSLSPPDQTRQDGQHELPALRLPHVGVLQPGLPPEGVPDQGCQPLRQHRLPVLSSHLRGPVRGHPGKERRDEIFSVTLMVVQGNCKSVDSTGARWCYVDSHHSSCQDLRFSARFPSNPWSYEACATPLPYAPLAPVVPPHTHVPSAAYTAPVQPVYTAPVHSHPVHSHPVHSHPQPVYGSNTGTLPADYLGQFIPKKAGTGSASKDAVKF